MKASRLNPYSESRKHLATVGESYSTHGWFAVKWGFFLIFTGLASVIHGIVPAWFPFTAPRNIVKLKKLVDERHYTLSKQ